MNKDFEETVDVISNKLFSALLDCCVKYLFLDEVDEERIAKLKSDCMSDKRDN